MQKLGVSVYPDIRPLSEILDYLALAAGYGYSRVFSSMFSVEGTPKEVLDLFMRLNDAAHAHHMETSLDINPSCMERLGAAPDDLSVFANIGCDILRMDGAYGEDENVLMLKNDYGIRIEYNASSLEPDAIRSLAHRGVDIGRMLACHNFYPQRYTGFSWDKYLQVNERIGDLGIAIGAFVASHNPVSHGVWDATEGLPTVERLRDYPADLQARILAAGGATDIFFGNAYATEEELKSVEEALAVDEPTFINEQMERDVKNSTYLRYEELLRRQKKVRIEPVWDLSQVEKTILFDFFPHLDMGDSSEWIWRSRGPRLYFGRETIAPRRYAGEYFEVGDVVMVNDNYKHYAGEVQVVLRPIKNDGTRNLVARVNEEEMTLFDVIREGDPVVFITS